MKSDKLKLPNPGQTAKGKALAVETGSTVTAKIFIPAPTGLEGTKNIFGNLEVCHKGSWLALDNGPGLVAAAGKPASVAHKLEIPPDISAIRLALYVEQEAGKLAPAEATLEV